MPQMIIVNSHINDLLAEAAANRLAKSAGSKESRNRTAAVLNGLRSILAEPAEKSVLPVLKAYPYRS
jgi:hypothetical protein